MGERKGVQRHLQPEGNLGDGEEGSAQKGHRHENQAAKCGHILMRAGQQCSQNTKKGKGQAAKLLTQNKIDNFIL